MTSKSLLSASNFRWSITTGHRWSVCPVYALMVVMCTAHVEYAIDAIPFRVMDYLLKPVAITAFVKAMERCRDEMWRRQMQKQSAAATAVTEARYLTVINKDQQKLIPLEKVIHLEAQGRYTLIKTTDGGQYMSSKPIQHYESKLPAHSFIRVHNSHIININEVKQLLRQKTTVIALSNNEEVPVAERRYKEVLDRLFI